MKINRVRIINYRNLKDVDVTLDSLIALIGENNSGKSNFLRAIALPLSSDDAGISKRLSWYDINKEAKNRYYEFLASNKTEILDGTISLKKFLQYIPSITITLFLTPEENEHYDVRDILCLDGEQSWYGGIQYNYDVKKPEDLMQVVKSILTSEKDGLDIKMSLLPMELYSFSLTIPESNKSITYETLALFRSVMLPAERDNFASNADKLGSKALSDVLRRGLSAISQVKIEKKYAEFFDTVRQEGKLDSVLNWQDYSDIPNAQEFFKEISILPNMPQMSSILSGIRLGYEEESMFVQGLGHRNLVLMSVILSSYINREHNLSLRLMTIEEPEAHLCNSNTLLIGSLFNVFSQKNKYTQIVYSTHNAELVNKVGIDKIIVFHDGHAYNLSKELSIDERDYLSANPNTDIFKLLYSQKTIIVEGITEELLIKSYLQTRNDLNDIKVLAFHKGFAKIIEIWKKVNDGSQNKLGIVRDYDNQPKAQAEHEKMQDSQVIVRTTSEYTLEMDITKSNYELLKRVYGETYGWSAMTADQIQNDWCNKKSDVMLRICHDMINGDLKGFVLPPHIQEIIDFMQGVVHES